MRALRQVESWPCAHAAVGVAGAGAGAGEPTFGSVEHRFDWASVTKLATAVAVLVACEEGIVELDEAAGPPGSTVRHLLAHASGLAFDEPASVAKPGRRRIYSNAGFELAAALVGERAEMPFSAYFEHVWGFPLAGSPGRGVVGTLLDLLAVARELLEPQRISGELLARAASVQFPGLDGVLPGFGRMAPNDWGLGLELRDAKRPHWTGTGNSPRTFGHFGWSGGFLWVDPDRGLALACLTDLDFGEWAKEAWPRLADAVLEEA